MNPHDVTSPTEEEMELERLLVELGAAKIYGRARDEFIDELAAENRKLRALMDEAARCLEYSGPVVHKHEGCTTTYEMCIFANCCEPRAAAADIRAALSQTKGGEET